MPVNSPIEGGIPTGAPEGWDAKKHGPCQTIDVRYDETEGRPIMQTAWAVTPAENGALGSGGFLYLTIFATSNPPRHPVIALGVHDAQGTYVEPGPAVAAAGGSASDGLVDGLGGTEPDQAPAGDQGASLQAALEGAVAELIRQASLRGGPDIGEIDDAGQLFMQGTFNLKELAEAMLEAAGRQIVPEQDVRTLQVFTLDQIGAQTLGDRVIEQLKKEGFPGHVDLGGGFGMLSTGGSIDLETGIRSHPNQAICPHCSWGNDMPTECLRDEWQRTDCQRCRKPLEYRGRTTGPERPENGGYTIETREPPAEAAPK